MALEKSTEKIIAATLFLGIDVLVNQVIAVATYKANSYLARN